MKNEYLLPLRSRIIPAQKAGIFYDNMSESDRILVLNGTWNYKGYSNGKAIFETRFSIGKEGKDRDILLHLDGIRYSYTLYINEKILSFSEQPLKPEEIDISEYINRNFENILTLEIQCRQCETEETALFRDSYLLYQNSVCLWDYEIYSEEDSLFLTLMPNTENSDLRAEISFDRRTRKTDLHSMAKVEFKLPSSELWNPEKPFLYDLVITVYQRDKVTEVHSVKVALKDCRITDGLFCINGNPVVFRGIRYKSFRKGKDSILSKEEIDADLSVFSLCGINAVLSEEEYPSPYLYELCAEKGFFLILNGFHPEEAYALGKNAASAVLWETDRNGAKYLSSRNVKRACVSPEDGPDEPEFSDFRHRKYPDNKETVFLAEAESDYPALILSYNDEKENTDYQTIWKTIFSSPQLEGAFLSGFMTPGGIYTEIGLPKPEFYEVKYAMSTLGITAEENLLCITSKNNFEYLDGCTMLWNISEDGKTLSSGTVSGLSLGPGETIRIPFPAELPEQRIPGAAYRLNVMIFRGERDLGYAQILLKKESGQMRNIPGSAPDITVSENVVTVSGNDFSVSFESGCISEFRYMNQLMTAGPIHTVYTVSGYTAEKKNGYTDIRFEIGTGILLYRIFPDASVLIRQSGKEFGISVPEVSDRILWYGRGWQENTQKRNASTLIGCYEASLDEFSGSRTDCRWAVCLTSENKGILVCGAPEFAFCIENGKINIDAQISVLSPYRGKDDAMQRARIDYSADLP